MKEIPRHECWRAVGMIPVDAGPTCLRALVEALNESGYGRESAYYPGGVLAFYATRYKAGSTKSVRCDVSRCEAETEMSAELYEILSEHG